MSTILSHRLTIPFALVLIVFILYSGTFDLGFFSDDYEGIARYQKWGFTGLNENYGNAFFMPFSFLFQALELQILSHYALIKIVNLLLFSGTGIFIYQIARRLFHEKTNSRYIALFTALVFLCSPFQTEAINWFSSQAYVLATFFSVWALWILLREKQSWRTPIYFNLLFLLALLNKEISLVLPLIVAVFYLAKLGGNPSILKKSLLGSLLILVLYFVLRWLTLGNLIGGYGEEVHANANPVVLWNGLTAYFAKFFGFYRYFPFGFRQVFALGMIILTCSAVIHQIWKRSASAKVSVSLLICFCISLLPVINLETSFLGDVQSDRYGYFPSVFFSLFLGSILPWKDHASRYWISAIWIYLSIGLLISTQTIWMRAAKIRTEFIIAIRAQKANDFYLLNVPDNCEGVYIFRHGLEEMIGNEKTIRPLSYQHLTWSSTVGEWYDQKNKTIILFSDGHFDPCEPNIGQTASKYDGRAFLRINKDSLGSTPAMYFNPETGKIYACSTE